MGGGRRAQPAGVRTARALRLAVLVGIAGFWAAAVVAGLREPGYDPTTDLLSPLAARGATHPIAGLAVFASGATAVLATGLLVWRRGQDPVLVPASLLLAAGAVLLAGVARLACPTGAAECTAADADLDASVHGSAVVAYQVLLVLALMVFGWARRDRSVGVAAIAMLLALGTLVLGTVSLGLPEGVVQRLWVGLGQAGLVLMASPVAGARAFASGPGA